MIIDLVFASAQYSSIHHAVSLFVGAFSSALATTMVSLVEFVAQLFRSVHHAFATDFGINARQDRFEPTFPHKKKTSRRCNDPAISTQG